MATPFVILMPAGRVGSNAIMDVLHKSKQLRAENEQLTVIRSQQIALAVGKSPEAMQQQCWDAQRQYVDQFYGNWLGKEGLRAAGLKVAFDSVANPFQFGCTLNQYEGKLIFLHRRNTAKQAVSIIRARENAERLKEKYGKASYGVDKSEDILPASNVDPAKLLALCKLCDQQLAAARAFASWLRWPCLTLEYSEVFQDFPAVIRDIGQFLALDNLKPATKWIKGTSDDLPSVIANFDELLANSSLQKYRNMLLEGVVSQHKKNVIEPVG